MGADREALVTSALSERRVVVRRKKQRRARLAVLAKDLGPLIDVLLQLFQVRSGSDSQRRQTRQAGFTPRGWNGRRPRVRVEEKTAIAHDFDRGILVNRLGHDRRAWP